MKSVQSIVPRLLFVLVTALATSVGARAEVTQLSATPNPARQGYPVTLSAYVNTGGRVDFIFLGRTIPTDPPLRPTRAGWVRLTFVPPNVVPAGSQCITKDWGAQQSGHRVGSTIRICR